MNSKYEKMIENLKSLGSVAVAFSGGVDSTFLLKAAKEALGNNALAVTVRSCIIPSNEICEAEEFCKSENIRHIICDVNPLDINGFADNPTNRCYICKKEIFSLIKQVVAENGVNVVAEGSNLDDNGDYRPGMKAIHELGVLSPLQTAGFIKQEIRDMSEELGLPTWNKPSFACLSSRFVYGEKITAEKLERVGKAEQILRNSGFKQFRVRIHGDIARIELLPEDFEKMLKMREELYASIKALGFSYVTMDLQGYRTGSMNEVIATDK